MNLASFTSAAATRDRFRYLMSRLRERLWVKPLIACALSVAGVLLANLADGTALDAKVPSVSQDSIIALLKIIAASMLAIATFAVASMMAAYASAGQIATARAFPLIVADDVSQNALSSYIGAFIFSMVALIAAMNGYYGRAGRFTLFMLMLAVLVLVVLTFVRWVDRIARLGRVGAIIGRVEHATADALARRRNQPHLGGLAAGDAAQGSAFFSATVGYVQRIDLATLQRLAEECGASVTVSALPGTFVVPNRPLGYLLPAPGSTAAPDATPFAQAFTVGHQRQFDDDPRFGVLALSEIACRALSPGINDPGTAIAVLASLQRLLVEAGRDEVAADPDYSRVSAPALDIDDLFDDAFIAIARDGAGTIEVALRLQRLLGEIGQCCPAWQGPAHKHAAQALARAELAQDFEPDLARLRARHGSFWGGTQDAR